MVEKDILEKYRIRVCGKGKAKEEAERMLRALPLHGIESKDRLIIQQMLDENKKIKVSILYDGNTVYPYQKYFDGLKALFLSDDLTKLTDDMYHFLSGHFDIAHYDKNGYINEYDGSFSVCWNSLHIFIPCWYKDLAHIIEDFKKFMENPVEKEKPKSKKKSKVVNTSFTEWDNAMSSAVGTLEKADLSALAATSESSSDSEIKTKSTKDVKKKTVKKDRNSAVGQLDFVSLFDTAI